MNKETMICIMISIGALLLSFISFWQRKEKVSFGTFSNQDMVVWCFLGLWFLAILATLIDYAKLRWDEWKAYKKGEFDGRALR